jgi:DNA-binding IclR family transcriptional regulator
MMLLNENGATLKDILNTTGKSNPTVKRYLQILKAIGLVKFVGSPKTGKYNITEQALNKITRAI